MTRYIILLIAVLLSYEVVAQYQYIPLPLSNSECRYRRTVGVGSNKGIFDFMYIFDGTDTLINGHTYKKVIFRYHSITGDIPDMSLVANFPEQQAYPIREDNKKVYQFYNGSDSLLYDFTLGIGDTLPNRIVIPGYANIFYVIQSIDTVNMYNALRKRFKAVCPKSYYDTVTVIEGLGSDRGLHILYPTSPAGGGTPTSTIFYCLTAPGIDYNPHNKPCFYIWPYGTPTSINNTVNEKKTSISPNPFTDIINIDSKENGSITIYNTLGAIVAEKELATGHSTVQTSSLSNGVYFIVLKDEAGRIIQKEKLIK